MSDCFLCDGKGWVEGTESAHEQSCHGECTNCPVPVAIQIKCELCDLRSRIAALEAKLKEAERLGDDLAEIVLLQDAWKNSSQLEEWQAFRSAKFGDKK